MSIQRKEQQIFEITENFLRLFFHCMSPAEREKFQHEIHEPGFLNNAEQLENRDQLIEWLEEPARFSFSPAWARFEKYIHRNRRLRMIRLCKIAALFILPILCGGILYFFLLQPVVPENKLLFTICENIQPVVSKAYITLDNGERHELGQVTAQIQEKDGTTIIGDKDKIIYNAADSAENTHVIYNVLTIPRAGEYMLVLSDHTKIWINSDSELKYPVSFSGDKREVYLKGEAYFLVTASTQPFIVHTSRGTVNVLGTEFNVRDYDDENQVVTTLAKGSVEFRDLQQVKQPVVLKPGYQLIALGTASDWFVQPVDLREYIGWKDGLYIFHDLTLEEMMKTIERNYDVTVFFANEICKSLRFSGDLRKYDHVAPFLKFIETGGDVRFEVKDKTICVYKK